MPCWLDFAWPGMDVIDVLRLVRALAIHPPRALLRSVPTQFQARIAACASVSADHFRECRSPEDLIALLALMLSPQPRRRRPPGSYDD